MERFPPLNALIAFDAAMRTNSFSMAARELCVTPGAIGQQIQKLETWLGCPLFLRRTRQVQPTEEALRYWQKLRPALLQIRDASLGLRESRDNGVWVSMPPTFAAKWFTRRMANFLTKHPEIKLHLDSSASLVDFESERVDIAIRYFKDDDPELEASLIAPDEARVYCSPDYARALALQHPDDLHRASLFYSTIQPYWPIWLARFSTLNEQAIAALPAIHVDQSLLAIESARLGQGMIMTSPLLTEEECASGSLIEPFPQRLPLDSGYYVVHPRRRPLRPAALRFKQWLLEQAAAANYPR